MQTRGGFGGPLDLLNAIAMEERAMAVWVPSAFPSASREPSGAWKVEPEHLGRNGRNRLGFKPGVGIHDFGAKDDARDGRRSPVDAFLHYADQVAPDFGGARTPDEAALKLIAALGDDYGWLRPLFRAGRVAADATFAEIRNVLNERDSAMASVDWPSGTLPEELETHVRHIARRRRGAESAGLFAATVAMIASTPKGITFDLLGDGSFVTKASVYAMLVGRSGITKSPMWRWALAPVQDAEREWTAQHRAAMASFEFAKAAADSSNRRKAKKVAQLEAVSDADVFAPVDDHDEVANPGEIEEPKLRQRLAGATTMEALTGLLAEADEGILIYSDELIGLIGGLDKYSKGRAGSADSAVLLECYDGGAVRVDRVSRRVRVDRSHLSIAGCATPAVLAPLLGNLGADGLLQRFLVCPIADQHYERDDSPLNQEAEARYARAVRLILDAGLTHGETMLLPDLEAIREWRDFDDWLASDAMAAARSEAERGWLSKAAETAGRIALGLALIDWAWARAGGEDAPFPKTMTGATMVRATRWLRQFAIPGVRTVYSAADTAGRHDDAKAIARLILELQAEGTERLTGRTVYKRLNAFRGRENAHRLGAALDALESAGWLRAENDKNESFFINPLVADFADFRNA